MKSHRFSLALALALLAGVLFASAQDAAYWRQKAAESRELAAGEDRKAAAAGGPNSTIGPQHLKAAQAYRNAAAEYDAKAGGVGGGTGFNSPNSVQQRQQLQNQQLQQLQNNLGGLFNAMQEREARQEQRAAAERAAAREEAEEARLERLRRDAQELLGAKERAGSLADIFGASGSGATARQAPSDPLDADWLLAKPQRPAGGDNLGAIIDDLLTDSRQLGRAPLDNLPPPKQPGEKGEWRTKPGLMVSYSLSDFLMLHADVYAFVCDAKGEPNKTGPFLRIHNASKKPFYFTSKVTGDAVNMQVAPGETYKFFIAIYRDKVQANAPLLVDLEATYWHQAR